MLAIQNNVTPGNSEHNSRDSKLNLKELKDKI